MSENISNSTETDNTSISSELLCPVCNELYVYPRNYDCGHTLCQLCMIKMDEIENEKCATHSAPKHSCPLCRHTTVKSWFDRPINITVQKLCSKEPQYKNRQKEVDKESGKQQIFEIQENINLSKLSCEKRKQIAINLYDTILPVLYRAAVSGLNYISIDEIDLVKNIEKCVDILSKMLFEKNNIYRVLSTRKECIIYLTKNSHRYRREHINSNYTNPNVESNEPVRNSNIPTLNSTEDILIRRLAETYVNALTPSLPRSPLRRPPLPPPSP